MKQIGVRDFLNYRLLSGLELSGDGKTAVFCGAWPREEENDYGKLLWKCDVTRKESVPLEGTEGVRNFCFLDENRILYSCLRGEDRDRERNGEFLTVFYERSLTDGAERELFRVPLKNASAKPMGGGRFLLKAVRHNRRPDVESMEEPHKSAVLKQLKREEDFIVCQELPFMSDGRGYINGQRTALYLYSEEEGCQPLTAPWFDVSFFAVSSDGRRIAWSGAEYDRYYVRSHGIYFYDVGTRERRTILTPGSYQIMGLGFLGDELVTAAAPWKGEGAFPNHDLYTAALDGGGLKLRHVHRREDFGNKGCSDCKYGSMTTWKTCDGELYYMTTAGAAVYLNRWKPGQTPVRLNRKSLIPVSLDVSGDGEVYVLGSEGDGLGELYRICPDGSAERLTSFHEKTEKERRIQTPREYTFRDRDGFEVHGFVVEPAGYEPGKKYPGLLEIHGGPRAAFTHGFFHEIQCLAQEGYFVFYCNPRGSAGGGEDFADIRNRRGTVDYEDLMAWTDFVLEQYPDIDKDRLGVLGGSYGGYMTNWIIGHTRRFAAAVSMRSIVDLSGGFGATDFGIWGTPGVYGATPWANEERLKEQSPFTSAMDITTPTLFLHSFEDHRCNVAGAMQLYSALQMKGVPTRMCLFKGECHELSRSGRPASRIKRLEEIISWLNQWLKPLEQ